MDGTGNQCIVLMRYLLPLLLLTGCATVDREMHSLICFGWCWRLDSRTVIEQPPPAAPEKQDHGKP